MSKEEIATLMDLLARRLPIDAPVRDRRASFERMASKFPLPPDLVTERSVIHEAGLSGELVSTNAAEGDRTILYLHGGAFVIGSSASYRELAGRLGRAARARVLVLDYRLAPENPFPAALEDSVAAYTWLINQAGLSPNSIAVAGDSAGGNLAVSSILVARDSGTPMPAAIGLISPYLDLTNARPSIRGRAKRDPFLDASKIEMIGQSLGLNLNRRDPRVSPIFADLTGLPAILVMVGSEEILHDDGVDFARNARAAGVNAVSEVWPDLFHIWPFFGPILEEGRLATDRLGAFLAAHLDDTNPHLGLLAGHLSTAEC